jgi:hypothetical protein
VFAVRPTTDARQSLFINGCNFTPVPTLPFAVRYTKTHGKDAKFAVRFVQAHGKHVPLPCVLVKQTASPYIVSEGRRMERLQVFFRGCWNTSLDMFLYFVKIENHLKEL